MTIASKTWFSQDELNRAYEQEIAAKDDLAKQMKELKKDYDFTRDQYESEVNAKSEMQKALSKSNTELNEWRQKYEEEAVVKNGQLEETNKGLVSELNTLGDEMLAAKSKVSLSLNQGTRRSESDRQTVPVYSKYLNKIHIFRFSNLNVSKSDMKMTSPIWHLIWKLFNAKPLLWTKNNAPTISLSRKPSKFTLYDMDHGIWFIQYGPYDSLDMIQLKWFP